MPPNTTQWVSITMAPKSGHTQQHQSSIAYPNAQEDDQHPSSSTSSSSNFDIKYNSMETETSQMT
jgi:hypothetical protein